MSKKKKVYGPCAFCGQPGTTKDHIPPQGMFAPGTTGLIWVPACEDCNGATSKDDEFLRQLAMIHGADRTTDGVSVGAAILRAIDKPEARGLRRKLLRSLSPVNLWFPAPTPTGFLFGGRRLKMKMDGVRVERTIKKIVRGLYYAATNGKRLSDEYEVYVHQLGKGAKDPGIQSNEGHILDLPEWVIGDRAFTFRCAFDPIHMDLSVWRMTFYGVITYMGYTYRNNGTHRIIMVLRDDQAPDGSARPILSFGEPED